MEKGQARKGWAEFYGYMVCLISVITFLISSTQLIYAVFDRMDPVHSGWSSPGSPSLASFEN